jgi:hypothetical protein
VRAGGDALGVVAHPELQSSELAGDMRAESGLAFSQETVDRLRALPRVIDTSDAKYLYVCIDPSNGSERISRMGIATYYFDVLTGSAVLVGLDRAFCPNPLPDMTTLVYEHLSLLRARFPFIPVVSIVEANLAVNCDAICSAMNRHPLYGGGSLHHVMHLPRKQTNEPAWGVCTLPRISWPRYRATMDAYLHMGRLQFAETITSRTAASSPEAVEAFLQELLWFRVQVAYHIDKPPTIVYSGKGPGKTDDLFCAAAIGLFHIHNHQRKLEETLGASRRAVPVRDQLRRDFLLMDARGLE